MGIKLGDCVGIIDRVLWETLSPKPRTLNPKPERMYPQAWAIPGTCETGLVAFLQFLAACSAPFLNVGI